MNNKIMEPTMHKYIMMQKPSWNRHFYACLMPLDGPIAVKVLALFREWCPKDKWRLKVVNYNTK